MISRLWLTSGLINAAGGVWMAATRWPMWQVQVPADALFVAAPIAAIANVIAAGSGARRLWVALLPANALSGLVLGFFAMLELESFAAGLCATLLGTVPSALAGVFLARRD